MNSTPRVFRMFMGAVGVYLCTIDAVSRHCSRPSSGFVHASQLSVALPPGIVPSSVSVGWLAITSLRKTILMERKQKHTLYCRTKMSLLKIVMVWKAGVCETSRGLGV